MIFTIHSITHSLWLKTASQLHLTLQNAIDCALIRSRGLGDGGKDAKLHNETTGWPMVLCQILSPSRVHVKFEQASNMTTTRVATTIHVNHAKSVV